jgi:hypothetical protein
MRKQQRLKREARKRECGHKVQYPTLTEAIAAKLSYQQTFKERMWAYECHHCGKYHIGHMRRK